MSDSFATPWTVVHQAPPSMRFPSKHTGVDCYFLLQGIFSCISGGFFTDWGTGKACFPVHACNFVLLGVCVLSHFWLIVTAWTVAHQGPLSMGFPRQEYWSGLLFPSPGGSSWPGDWTWVSCIGRQILYLSHLWSPLFLSYIAFSIQRNGTVSWWRVFKLEFEFYLQFLLHSTSVVVFGLLVS